VKSAERPISVERVKQSRLAGVDFATIPFSSVFSDHMLVMEYKNNQWSAPKIKPYGPLLLPPNISALQYAVSVFEGLKAHRGPNGEILLFRPWENARRLNRSAARLAMPEIPEALFLEGLRELIRTDAEWVPTAEVGSALHPTLPVCYR
jgi:branched-chain amino acid aminotransferase